jgi:miniconductance mechanosensitive channel
MLDTLFDGSLVAGGIALGLVVLCAVAAYLVTRVLLLRVLNPAIARAKPAWDEIILERRVFHLTAYAAPAIVINLLLPFLFFGTDARRLLDLIDKALSVYLIVIGLLVVNATLNAALDIYRTFELSKTVPLTGVVQGIKVVAYGLAGLFIVAALLGLPPAFLLWPVVILTVGLGFVFKDPILGFVAGIELAADNLVAIGDWIEVPGADASGHVLEISLVAVKVQNWDNTITMIPTYDLVSNPFTNWRGMFEGGGRRFKRPVYIDTNTIKFCTEEMLEAFSRLDYVSEYIEQRRKELADLGVALGDDAASLTDGRGFTNLGVFRAYVIGYLRNHPLINQDLMLMVRLLEPTPHGLPVEIYAFTKKTEWIGHEMIQSDIVDHVLSTAPEFGLKAFQYPAGTDFSQISQRFEGQESS